MATGDETRENDSAAHEEDSSPAAVESVEEPPSQDHAAGEEAPKAAADETPVADNNNDKAAATALPVRPIKRARTAYFIFADDKRAEISSMHPGEGVGAVARVMGQMWSSLGEEEKASYQQRAAEERARVSKELEKYKDLVPDSVLNNSSNNSNNNGLSLPVGRIRKIVKLDPEVKGLSKEALLLITKCTELATTKLGLETVKVAQLQNRRKLLPDDVAEVCATREQFLFLKEDVKDLQREQLEEAATVRNKQKENSAAMVGNNAAGKPLTAYFKSAN